MDFAQASCTEFVTVLASNAPVPGGGGASALVGAIGTALGNMVGSLTVGKKKYADVEEEMVALKAKCDAIQADLLALIARDAEVFEPMSAVYKMPKDTEAEREEKDRAMEACLRDAASVPLSLMELCCRGIDIAGEAAEKGSRLLISDAGCSAASLDAALSSAYLNVLINTSSMKDRAYAAELEEKAKKIYLEADGKARKVYSAVLESIQG